MEQTVNTLADYTKEWLLESINKGASYQFHLFYGHKESADGAVTDSCFSQWFPADFEIEGINYKTAEHFMMAEKARLFQDQEALSDILACATPREAKALGRKVRGFDEQVWHERRFGIVVRANQAKFSQNEGFKQRLQSTAPKVLVEASPRDRIWGIGMGQSNIDAHNPQKWRGRNLLGFALTKVRDEMTP